MRSKVILSLAFVLSLSVAFAQQYNYSNIDSQSLCSYLSLFEYIFYDVDPNQGFVKTNEASQDFVDSLNDLLWSIDGMNNSLSILDGTSISLEIYNNDVECFTGSIYLNNHQITSIVDNKPSNAGSNNDNILIHVDLSILDKLLPYFTEEPPSDFFGKVRFYYGLGTDLVSYMWKGTLTIKPITSVFKLFDFANSLSSINLQSIYDYNMASVDSYDVEDLDSYMDEYNITYEDIENYLNE